MFCSQVDAACWCETHCCSCFCLLMLFCYKNGLLEFHPSACVCVCCFFFVCVCVCVCQCMQCRLRFLRRSGKFRGWSSQRSLHSAPIFRLLLKVAVNGTHQCDSHNFWGVLSSNKQSVTEDELLQAELGGSVAPMLQRPCLLPFFWLPLLLEDQVDQFLGSRPVRQSFGQSWWNFWGRNEPVPSRKRFHLQLEHIK